MSVLNPLAREVSAKIVFYGPGLSGKTTTLQTIHQSLKPTHRGELVSLETEGDRTLFFDFLPVYIEKVQGLDVRLQLYTVPGQVFYGATRQLVLAGADGIVFVADSQRAAKDRNLESLDDLRENLKKEKRSLGSTPFVIQYNKRDLPDVMDVEEMRATLNQYSVPDFETVASKGVGVEDSLRTMIRLVGRALSSQHPREKRRQDTAQRLSLDPDRLSLPKGGGEGIEREISSALSAMAAPDGRSESISVEELPHPPEFQADGPLGVPRAPSFTALVAEDSRKGRDGDVQTIQAPAAAALSFSSLFLDPRPVLAIEHDIATGHFAEAVHRAASGVSEILDGLLGPHDPEGSGTRAQLLGLDGREYLELRRLASRPASTLTQNDALFAFYLLMAARIKKSRLARY